MLSGVVCVCVCVCVEGACLVIHNHVRSGTKTEVNRTRISINH